MNIKTGLMVAGGIALAGVTMYLSPKYRLYLSFKNQKESN
jgi:hypothetical protein